VDECFCAGFVVGERGLGDLADKQRWIGAGVAQVSDEIADQLAQAE